MTVTRVNSGFTLIELLVVMTIMALLSGVVTVAVARAAMQPDDASVQLAQLAVAMNAASTQAVLTGDTLGARITALDSADTTQSDAQASWQIDWLRWHNSQWVTTGAPAMFRLVELPMPQTDSDAQPSGNLSVPAVVFYATGDISAFQWHWNIDGQAMRLEKPRDGRVHALVDDRSVDL